MYKKIGKICNEPFIKTIFVLLVSFSISLLFFGKNLSAKMGIIDDSSYLAREVLYNKTKVIANFVNAPELKSFGSSQRFRVIYYLANDLETAVFGFDAFYFYLVNIIIFAFFIFTVFYIAQEYLGNLWAFLATMFIISQKYFAHIFTRLGTAETWTVLGLSIFALSFNSIYKKTTEEKGDLGWREILGLVFGSIIMIGSKENFALTGILLATLLGISFLRKKISQTLIYSSLFILAFNLYQASYVLFAQNRNGVDIYQNNTSSVYRLKLIIKGALGADGRGVTILFTIFIITLFAFLLHEIRKGKIDFSDVRIIKLFWSPLLVSLILEATFIFNLFFYNGIFYTLSRYSFPSVLTAQILLVAYFYYLFILFQDRFKKADFTFLSLILAPVVAAFLIVSFFDTVKYSIHMSNLNVEATTKFQSRLTELAAEINKDPEGVIVFSTYNPIDFEPLGSVALYLKNYKQISNKIMIRKYSYEGADNSPLISWIDSQVKKYEVGNEVFIPNRDDISNNCYNVDFSGETKTKKCQNLGKIWRYGSYPY